MTFYADPDQLKPPTELRETGEQGHNLRDGSRSEFLSMGLGTIIYHERH